MADSVVMLLAAVFFSVDAVLALSLAEWWLMKKESDRG